MQLLVLSFQAMAEESPRLSYRAHASSPIWLDDNIPPCFLVTLLLSAHMHTRPHSLTAIQLSLIQYP